ncbi:hypothetical protein LUZ60_016510 [Juncus effusus]|nr:hypothetical protein LUZ60_016510 [Juncus effusus]
MAGRSGNSVAKHSYQFFNPKSGPIEPNVAVQDEFDESEIWSGSAQLQSDPIQPVPKSRLSHRKPDQSRTVSQPGPCSLPVHIPDWSKILGKEYNNSYNNYNNSYDFWDEESEGGAVIPPHEYLCKNRVCSSFSVHEGVGRTLKGRDLSRVRDAVWEKTGFQD